MYYHIRNLSVSTLLLFVLCNCSDDETSVAPMVDPRDSLANKYQLETLIVNSFGGDVEVSNPPEVFFDTIGARSKQEMRIDLETLAEALIEEWIILKYATANNIVIADIEEGQKMIQISDRKWALDDAEFSVLVRTPSHDESFICEMDLTGTIDPENLQFQLEINAISDQTFIVTTGSGQGSASIN